MLCPPAPLSMLSECPAAAAAASSEIYEYNRTVPCAAEYGGAQQHKKIPHNTLGGLNPKKRGGGLFSVGK